MSSSKADPSKEREELFMELENPIKAKLIKAITPIASIGVGSAIWTVCKKLGKNADTLQPEDLPVVKKALLVHYEKFYAHKIDELNKAISNLN
jgi:hypothetical protein